MESRSGKSLTADVSGTSGGHVSHQQHPGILVKSIMHDQGVSINAFAKVLKVSPATVYRIVSGQSGISPEMAIRLSSAVGCSALFWMQRQAEYDLCLARKKLDVSQMPGLT